MHVHAGGRFNQINRAWSEVLGWSEEELLGRDMLPNFVHPDDHERTLAQSAQLEEHGESAADFENRWRCTGGSYRWLLWSAHLSRAGRPDLRGGKGRDEAKRNERFFQAPRRRRGAG